MVTEVLMRNDTRNKRRRHRLLHPLSFRWSETVVHVQRNHNQSLSTMSTSSEELRTAIKAALTLEELARIENALPVDCNAGLVYLIELKRGSLQKTPSLSC